ncbi:YciI family protein [Pelagicoccus sp. SDUM812003]|uniref:YciI family protein n=1 Tax=Pelagicoccus sp. SDUM812003 TaxID=3041267 RepID=UPI00280E9B8B|nr:YciI family protein [Pelagicoccus sp. SDUM812003]MDQ8201399.1 YciI family protein [Pelagicoccus sp. SDUM812003]
MKYLILLHAEEGAWSPEDYKAALAESIKLCHELASEDVFLGAHPLQAPETGAVVRVREGKRFVSDGPYAETKEYLGGYFLVDVPSMEEAIEIAARIPGSHRGTAEIRPVLEVEGLPGGV